MANSTELYTNLSNVGRFYYAREFESDVTYDRKELTLDGISFTKIVITGIPDGVSPIANESLIDKNTRRRLYIFSDSQLSNQYLETLDKFYGKTPYPIVQCSVPNTTLATYPINNFYLTRGPPASTTEFVEYRYFAQRHLNTNIAYDVDNKVVYKLALPERPLLIIIMPRNFIKTSNTSGYFRFDNNLIIRVYSQYILSSEYEHEDTNETTKFSTHNLKLKSVVEKIFGKLGIHKIVSNSDNQLYGYDKFITMVVGSVANIVLP